MSAATLRYRAPGRINLIGDHTDYNGGLVLPMAIDRACRVTATPNDRCSLRIHAVNTRGDFEQPLDGIATAKPRGDWSDYVVGVAVELLQAGFAVDQGLDLHIESDVPMGAGLSSSAAIEVATALALLGPERAMGSGAELAKLCQRAENNFAGTPCGIMDQFVVVHGRKGCAVRIDCRSLDYATVTLPDNMLVVAVNSMVKRELGASQYGIRRGQCEQATALLGLESLRDATLEQVSTLEDEVLRKRARHVVSENQRVEQFLGASTAQEMGRLLIGSHESLRDDYEVSCEELDYLVATALQIDGVYGARMTGGGFGGCTVNLIERSTFDHFASQIREKYKAQYGIDAQIFACEAAAGAGPD